MSEQKRRIDVFFYGLFMDPEVLREKGVDPMSSRLGKLSDFTLIIGDRATLVARPGKTVYGIVYSVTQAEVDRLYSDASVSAYRPEEVKVELEQGQTISALCFNLPTPPAENERNSAYATKLQEVAKQVGLPADYVASVVK